MASRPAVVVFDVNETLSDMSAMGRRFVDVGAPEWLARLWFASLLRDGFALTAAGGAQPFARLGREALHQLLAGVDLDRELDEAVEHVMDGFGALGLHPDVVPGVRALRARGWRLVTLSNGAATVAAALFERHGIASDFEQLLTVEDAGAWKPARAAYAYAAERCGVPPAELMLVAVHPWDIDGAARAGLSTAWVNRSGSSYPTTFLPPTTTVSTLTELADRLTS